MKIFLAGNNGRKDIVSMFTMKGGEDIKPYLAGVMPRRNDGEYDKIIQDYRPNILESFYYVDADTERLLPYYGDFLLDSGAFTFMQNSKTHVEWEEYIERYADFINRNNVAKFFELDIDSVVGYQKVLEYRNRLEKLTSKQCIPVWHSSRGKDEFLKMCDQYQYVALGGIAISHRQNKKNYKVYQSLFPWFINEAHRRNTKIHGLGYTSIDGLKKYHFDSVDSTAWTTGNRFGYFYYFDGKTMHTRSAPEGKMIKGRETAVRNYIEWIKFIKYAEKNL